MEIAALSALLTGDACGSMLILSIKRRTRVSYTMKLHLPVLLRKCLLSVLSAVAITSGTAVAGVMHSDVTMPTYTDFGQNKGR